MDQITKIDSLDLVIDSYENTASCNDFIWQLFTDKTNEIKFLKKHREYVEANNLGFGDRAFHYMWYLLLSKLFENKTSPNLLEIGVYKGQVISLWEIIAQKLGHDINIHAISPFSGNINTSFFTNNHFLKIVRKLLSKSFREDLKLGNMHPKLDYLKINENLFSHFGLSFNKVNKHIGLSNDFSVLEKVGSKRFDIVYIDGNHRYDVVKMDIYNYSPLVNPNGYLVMDDASYFLPGSIFWKGYKEVSKACNEIENLGFKNVLNVGHNRVYRRISV